MGKTKARGKEEGVFSSPAFRVPERSRGRVLVIFIGCFVGLLTGLVYSLLTTQPAHAQALRPELIRKPIDVIREVSYTDYRQPEQQVVRFLTGLNLFRAGPDIYSPTDTVLDHVLVQGPATVEGKWTCQYARLLEGGVRGPVGMRFTILRKTEQETTKELETQEDDQKRKVLREAVFNPCPLKYQLNLPAGSHEILIPFQAISYGLWPIPENRWRVTLGVPEIRHGVRVLGSDASDFVNSSYRSYTGSPWYYWQFLTNTEGFVFRLWETSGDGVIHSEIPFEARLTTRPSVANLARGMLHDRDRRLGKKECETKISSATSGGLVFLRQGTCGPGAKLRTNAQSLGQAVPVFSTSPLTEVSELQTLVDPEGFLVIRVLEKNLVSFRPGVLIKREFQFPAGTAFELTIVGQTQHYWNTNGQWRVADGPAATGPNSPFVNSAEVNRLVIEQDGKASYTEGGVE